MTQQDDDLTQQEKMEKMGKILAQNEHLCKVNERNLKNVLQLCTANDEIRKTHKIQIEGYETRFVVMKKQVEEADQKVHALQEALSNAERSVIRHLAFCLLCALIAVFYAYRA